MASYLLKQKKEDLIVLVEDVLGESSSNLSIPQLKDLILKNDSYEEEFVKCQLTFISDARIERKQNETREQEEKKLAEKLAAERELEEQKRKNKIEERRLQNEESKLQAELEEKRIALEEAKHKEYIKVQLEKLKMESGLCLTPRTTTSKDVNFYELMTKFTVDQDINLYLVLFERQATRGCIDKKDWVSHLIKLLPCEIVARVSDEHFDDYEHVKNILLQNDAILPPRKESRDFLTPVLEIIQSTETEKQNVESWDKQQKQKEMINGSEHLRQAGIVISSKEQNTCSSLGSVREELKNKNVNFVLINKHSSESEFDDVGDKVKLPDIAVKNVQVNTISVVCLLCDFREMIPIPSSAVPRSGPFCEVCYYNRENVPRYSEMVYTPTELTKESSLDQLPWSYVNSKVFSKVKTALVNATGQSNTA